MALLSLLEGPQGLSSKRTKITDAGKTVLLIFDVVNSITPKYEADVTESPIEKSNDISDNYRPKNISLSIEGFASESPLTLSDDAQSEPLLNNLTGLAVASVSVFGSKIAGKSGSAKGAALGAVSAGLGMSFFKGKKNAAQATQDFLIGLVNDQTVFNIQNQTKTYEDLVITSLSFPKDNTTGKGVKFMMECKQIQIIEANVIKLSQLQASVVHSAAKKISQGKQSNKEASSGNKKSILASLTGFGKVLK